MTSTLPNLQTKPLIIEVEFNPFPYDIDFAGIVSNIVYVRWIEDLRIKMLNKYFPLEDLLKLNLAPTILSTNIEYKHQTRLFDKLIGSMWVTDMGLSSWEIAVQFTNCKDETIVAEAIQKGLFLDINKKRPGKIPKSLKDLFEQDSRLP